MGTFKRAWAGQERLWKVWWLLGLADCLFSLLWSQFVIWPYALANSSDRIGAVAFYLVSVGISVLLAIANWRCAFNVEWRGWGWIARALIVFSIVPGILFTWFGVEMFLGRVPPEYGRAAALLWRGTETTQDGAQAAVNATATQAAITDSYLATQRGPSEVGQAEQSPENSPNTIPSAQLTPDQTARDSQAQPSQPEQLVGASPNITPPDLTTPDVTAWNNGVGGVAYLDSRWRPAAAPDRPLPDSTYMAYEGWNDVAVFGAVPSELAPEVYGADFAFKLGGYEVFAPPDWVNVAGRKVWIIGLKSTNVQPAWLGLLYVFRDPRGYVWYVFTATASTQFSNSGFDTRSEALAAAFVKGAFAQ